MATRLLNEPRRIVAYLPNLRTAVKHLRAFSSYDERKSSESYVVVEASNTEDSDTVWPDKLGILGQSDSRFTLPGLTGPISSLQPPVKPFQTTYQPAPDVLTAPLPHQRHAAVIAQLFNDELFDSDVEELERSIMKNMHVTLECQAMECSQAVKKDFGGLFPDRDFSSGPLVVVAISQKTENDMTSWSSDVENEREDLTQLFVSGSEEICQLLEKEGFWADFIDPSSGTPYYGSHTNTTLFETDERYRHLGFEIEDLGCCKVLSHPLWGTKTFVGCLFTNAPVDHPIISHLMSQKTWDDSN